MTPIGRVEQEFDGAPVLTGDCLQHAPLTGKMWKSLNSPANSTFLKGNVVVFGERVMPISTGVAERPTCPVCKHRMGLGRISPGQRGFEERTFECSTCLRFKKISLPIDPMKTDAVGWLASELLPPR